MDSCSQKPTSMKLSDDSRKMTSSQTYKLASLVVGKRTDVAAFRLDEFVKETSC